MKRIQTRPRSYIDQYRLKNYCSAVVYGPGDNLVKMQW